jgi:Zinc dependent phospholipase C
MLRPTLLILLLCPPGCAAYSVLSHEAIVDAAWEPSIKPVILKYFPDATEEQLRKAHGYAYGGAIIQDLGYYPFGNHLFTDLAHYVRSGDFVRNLLLEAQNLDEYAFALGSLAHYASDNNGHPIGINRAVPLMYPNVRRRVGAEATYEDDKTGHLKVEFSFDVLQVANGHYAPQSYHDFIGFEVSKPVLERAFRRTYGLELKSLFLSEDLALGSYRRSVSTIIPEMTKVAWDQKKKELIQSTPGLTRRRFIYNLRRSSYEKEWGRQYQRPGAGARVLAFLLNLIPKVGPFRALAFKPPTPEADQLFMKSFNATVERYRELLAQLRAGHELELPNTNFDTGKPVRFADYRMADEAYSKLLDKLRGEKFATVDEPLRQNLLAFFDHPGLDAKTAEALAELKASNSPKPSSQD